MAEFIARANYDMAIGNFELDFDDGEIRFKSSSPIQGPWFTKDLVMLMVLVACRTMDEYLPGLLKVIAGESSAADAIRTIEGGDS